MIAEDGFPVKTRIPDPAAFALHKLWVSAQPDRRADKAKRDRHQAAAVALLDHLDAITRDLPTQAG